MALDLARRELELREIPYIKIVYMPITAINLLVLVLSKVVNFSEIKSP